MADRGGPLAGLRIIEFAGIGPGPFCGMMLADHGAEVIRIDRAGARPMPGAATDVLARGRRSIALNLKSEAGRALAHTLCAGANGLIEGFRPGAMERLGLGPEVLLRENPKLIYGRMTGWGQTGPYAAAAGHDINYIALAGALAHFGRAGEKPTAPINLIGDFGGGGMMLAFGMVSALLHVANGGQGQVIDAAMTDGSALLMGMLHGMQAGGMWSDARGTNLLDSGAHFYDTYETADGQFISIGSIEPQFYGELRRLLGLDDDPAFDAQMDPASWPALSEKLAARIKRKTRAEWDTLLAESEACYAPVLTMAEARAHPHNVARETFVEVGDHTQPAPAPRYSETPSTTPEPAVEAGADTASILAELGVGSAEQAKLREAGAVG